MVERVDCVVIGGGPAGGAMAFSLAQRGVSVMVIEKGVFPRAKVCGEYISPAARGVLEEILPRQVLLAAGAKEIGEFVVEVGSKSRIWKTPQKAWGLSRGTLDSLILERVSRSGGQVRMGVGVKGVIYPNQRDGDVVVELMDGSKVGCAVVVHADGSGRHDPAGPVGMVRDCVGYKCHMTAGSVLKQMGALETVDGRRVVGEMALGARWVSMRACAGAYLGMIVVENDLATCAMTVKKSMVAKYGGDGDAVLRGLLGEKANGLVRTGPWMTCGVARSGYMEPGHARSVRIGNAAGAVDPIGGEGIGLALWSGWLAGREIGEAIHRADEVWQVRLKGAKERLGRAYRRRLRWRRVACRVGAEVFMRPWLVKGVWPLLGGVGTRAWYLMSGKPSAA